MVVQHQTQNEALAAGFRELAHAGKAGSCNGRRCLDFDADDVTARILDDDIDLVVVPVTEVKELEPLVVPAGEL